MAYNNLFDRKEYSKRRKTLMQMMGKTAIAIIPAASVCIRNKDAEYPYRQNSDFLYLTGLGEPEAVAVLAPGRAQGEFLLFCRENDAEQELWHGRRLGIEGVINACGADDAFPIADIDDILPGLLEGRERIFYTIGQHANFDKQVITWVNQVRNQIRTGRHAPHEFIALDYYLHEMRLFKSRAEIAAMRKAATISANAHKRAMQACQPNMMEYALEAELLYEFHRAGACPAYSSIVGGGENACILHYTDNNADLKDGDLVLIDAGAEYQGYASDITRTFPVNGRFSEAQKALYEWVLAAQQAAIEKAIPGNHWQDPHEAAVKTLTQGLIELGLLKGRKTALIKQNAYRQFYMHRTGHWLGLDVHDVGEYKIDHQWRLLEPGMVLTIEPGLYIRPQRNIAKRYHNIGIRIEDDVLITQTGNDVLSQAAPKTIAAIEALMA